MMFLVTRIISSRRVAALGATETRFRAATFQQLSIRTRNQQQQMACIATATVPCLGGRRRTSKSNNTRRGKHKNMAVPSTNKSDVEKIADLKRFLAGEVEETPVREARTISSGPAPSMSEQEFFTALRPLWEEVLQFAKDDLNAVARERIVSDRIIMEEGGLSTNETRKAMLIALEKEENSIPANDCKMLELALSHWKQEGFYSILQDTLVEVGKETLRVMISAIIQAPAEEFFLHDRLRTLVLEEIPPFRARDFYSTYTELCFAKRGEYVSYCAGISMLPTIPEHPTPRWGYPIDVHNMNSIMVGDVVSFVMVRPRSGVPGFMGKRVGGLAGDIMFDIEGDRVVVPEGHFWAIGDNKAHSHDSRHYGAIPLTNLRQRYSISLENLTSDFVELLSSSYTYIRAEEATPSSSENGKV